MGGGYFSNAGGFLLNTLFGLYIGALMLRLLLQMARADFYNPLSQAIVKLTNPAVRPLRRYIPAIGKVDTASVLLITVLQILNTWWVGAMFGARLGWFSMLVVAFAALLSKLIYLYIFAILIQVIASWVAPGAHNPVLRLVDALTEPLLRPIRRVLPNPGGLDLSSLVIIVLLQLALLLVVAPLADFGALR